MSEPSARYGRPYPRQAARIQRLFTTTHTVLYRLSGGRTGGTLFGLPMLLLTTWGRRTAQLRTAPLLYLPVDGAMVVVGSNGGAAQHPTWWFNLRDRPEGLVQVRNIRGRIHSRSVSEIEHRQIWPMLVEIYPTYERYQERTNRPIPLLMLQPIDTLLAEVIRTHPKHRELEKLPEEHFHHEDTKSTKA